ncbi:MAG: bifunctional chorismate mutase/prephenate dehydratase [Eubacteriales bacterium]|nr:bifunctional chorismate mutase/prephenate dehydratase [Eubacteriales bacterium]
MDLKNIRDEIDEIDDEIVALYERRVALTDAVATYKMETGKPVLDRQREKQKLAFVKGTVNRPGIAEDAAALIANIMVLSRKNQYDRMARNGHGLKLDVHEIQSVVCRDVRIGYQGEAGGYGYLAMKRYFGDYGTQGAYANFEDVVLAVEREEIDCGVIPIENSTAGEVTQVYDLLIRHQIHIVDEVTFPIRHALLGVAGTRRDEIRTVYSHPQALMQCAGFLAAHKEWLRVSLSNTAVSARKVAEDADPTQAAIGSKEAAKFFGLEVIAEGLADEERNTTKFIIIKKRCEQLPNANRILISFRAPHEIGSLYELLSHTKYNGLNMTKIFSRPTPERQWDYSFFVEIDGNLKQERVRAALLGIAKEATDFQILGSYPEFE